MSRPAVLLLSGWFAAACLALAAFVYLHNLGSKHAATNPDELLYLQIARLTADTGQWLPLQAADQKHRNTKPPGLFWQGMMSTDWGAHWDLRHVRYPNALYTLAAATMVLILGRKLGGSFACGATGALAYLAFFGVYRHGRVFLTSAPETFWLFAPFFLLLLRPADMMLGWRLALAFGVIIGVALLYKSFAMLIPAAAALGWWTLRLRGYRLGAWLRADAGKLLLLSILSLGVFALWFWFDPHRQFIWHDFILKENAGKFDADESGYLATALWGKQSIWQYAAGWATNAGLLAPAVLAVFVLAWRGRRQMAPTEKLLWIWIITLFVFHLFPNLRYERYLLPAMPAVAVLCGLYWARIPRWVLVPTSLAASVLCAGMAAGAILIDRSLAEGRIYSAIDWAILVGSVIFSAAGLLRPSWTRSFALPSVILVYLAFAVFLRPFDGPRGAFEDTAIAAALERDIIVPAPFASKDEIYRFLLPGSTPKRIREKEIGAALAAGKSGDLFILSRPLDDLGLETDGKFVVLGRRLSLQDYFTGEQTADMLRGNVARHLFAREFLVRLQSSASAPPQEQQAQDGEN
ncbi:MAG: hypothetical protein JHC52_02975 [Chthoniobacterales bacterium]|nr:hypothetical protein [Chthoniobacterales bacterium]